MRGLIVQPDTPLLALGMLGTPADFCGGGEGGVGYGASLADTPLSINCAALGYHPLVTPAPPFCHVLWRT